jgi:hypothetical protein
MDDDVSRNPYSVRGWLHLLQESTGLLFEVGRAHRVDGAGGRAR